MNNISQCSEGTFEWILKDQSSEIRSGPPEPESQRFRSWLREGQGIFWIKGKPGSGKSTFMKFLVGRNRDNPHTMDHLTSWATPRGRPRIVSFYFWLADDTRRQNTFHGFLCHILFQLLSDQSASFPASLMTADRIQQKQNLNNWDEKELEMMVVNVACQVANQKPLCFFIDGLDECLANDLNKVVNIIKELRLRSPSDVKFCISSRPEQQIENRIQSLEPQYLNFHDLTFHDIERHVTNAFKDHWEYGVPIAEDERKRLIMDIVVFAEGVFLWAMLVTKQLCESVESGDTFHQVHEQLKSLPHDILQLYNTMLENFSTARESRQDEAAAYFNFLVEFPTPKYGYTPSAVFPGETLATQFIPLYEHYHGKTMINDRSHIIQKIRQRISVLCGGMVEFLDDKYDAKDVELQTASFFHRTAYDFFREPSGAEILSKCKLSQAERLKFLVDGIFHHVCVVNKSRNHGEWPIAKDGLRLIKCALELKDCSYTEKENVIQYIQESLTRLSKLARPIKGIRWNSRVTGDGWVYVQTTHRFGTPDVVDLTGIRIFAGDDKILPSILNSKRKLCQRYKEYLLIVCTSRLGLPSGIEMLLDHGVNPNARFYWDMKNRLKSSPWLYYLLELVDHVRLSGRNDSIEMAYRLTLMGKNEKSSLDIINEFLNHGASLEDRTVVGIRPGTSRLFPPDNNRLVIPTLLTGIEIWRPEELLIAEVNSKYLLDYLCFCLRKTDPSAADRLQCRTVIPASLAYCRIVLVAANNRPVESPERRIYHVISSKDSQRIMDVICDSFLGRYNMDHEAATSNEAEIRKLIEQARSSSSERVDFMDYLRLMGYYKNLDDPEVLQGPIPIYEDDEGNKNEN